MLLEKYDTFWIITAACTMHVIEEQFKHTGDQDDTQGDKV